MLLVLNVPTRAVMDLMGWSQVSMTSRYQHVPTELCRDIADRLGGLFWKEDDGPDGASMRQTIDALTGISAGQGVDQSIPHSAPSGT